MCSKKSSDGPPAAQVCCRPDRRLPGLEAESLRSGPAKPDGILLPKSEDERRHCSPAEDERDRRDTGSVRILADPYFASPGRIQG